MNAVVEHRPVWLEEVSARWQEVLNDRSLRDLPYKIETNRAGQLVMSPAKNVHGFYQARIASLLQDALGGHAFVECSIATPDGVKVADTAWCSDAFMTRYGFEDPYAVAPEICVEIKSPSNAESELMGKVRLYLDAGATEVWLVDSKGGVRVFDRTGAVAASRFAVDVSAVALDAP
jgi:Uma2 family endonuclease